jgi:hypothetical protein
MKQCTDIGARPRVCGDFLNVSNVCLNSRRWFVLCFVYISYLVLCTNVILTFDFGLDHPVLGGYG